MAGTLFTQPGVIPVNASGTPYAGATLTFTQAGTSTPCDVYTTAALTTAAGVSGVVTADSAGYFEPVYLDQSTSYDYKCVLKDSGGSVLKTWDNIPRSRIPIWCGTAGGTADAITLTPSPEIASYVTGQTYRFLSGFANTGAVTVAISGLAAKSVKKQGATALAAGDIPASAIVDVTYDGSNLQVIGLSLAAIPTLAGTNAFAGANSFTGAVTLEGGVQVSADSRLWLSNEALTYGTTIATDLSLGNHFIVTVTDTVAFTISNPTQKAAGQRITYVIKNASGGVMGAITWGSDFKMSAFTNPATGYSRSIDFIAQNVGGTTYLVEVAKSAADVPNP